MLLNWDEIHLVVFDVDGTLYCQKKLRRIMLGKLILDAIGKLSTKHLRVLIEYRSVREQLAEQRVINFNRLAIELTADSVGVSSEYVEGVVDRWISIKPLPYLLSCRYPGIAELFCKLRQSGKKIAILSDYPAAEKIKALGLTADYIVSSCDEAVGILKPDPKGLLHVLTLASAAPVNSLLIGDRIERDGQAAVALGVGALIRSAKPIKGWNTFIHYDDMMFDSIKRPKVSN